MSDASRVIVKTFHDRIEAELAQSALEAAGIESMLWADDAAGLQPAMALTNGVSVVVRAEDAQEAADILDAPTSDSRR